jgi:hypothetical protein
MGYVRKWTKAGYDHSGTDSVRMDKARLERGGMDSRGMDMKVWIIAGRIWTCRACASGDAPLMPRKFRLFQMVFLMVW